MLINATDLTIKYLDKTLFDNVSFIIGDNDLVGIIGVNGSGKSSLLKSLVDLIEINSGEISKRKNLEISYLPQEREFNLDSNIIAEFIRLSNLSSFEAKTALSKLGITEFDKLLRDCSGGMKKRISIAIALSKPCDLLILDEPTNHLDIWMIDYLEKYLIKFNKAMLLVTHDRYFLERVTKKIMDIDHSKIYMYPGNYSTYLEKKAERLVDLQARSRHLAAIYKKEAAWAKMNAQARSTKSRERMERVDKLKDDLDNVRGLMSPSSKVNLESFKRRMGKTTIIIENISQEIDDKVLFKDFSYILSNKDRLGIIGGNGVGKTTLIKTILGYLPPKSGTVEIGETIKIGYYNQNGLELDSDMKIIDYLKQYGEYIRTPSGLLSCSQLLELYGFTTNFHTQYISKLSGGEKRRLQLLSILLTNPNVLVLDEPTNDLDISTLETLEDYLESFEGAVMVISHDRFFLDKVCDHLLILENGNLTEYNGIVSDYLTDNPVQLDTQDEKVKIIKEEKKDIPRFTSKEKKEFDNIEEVISSIEDQIKQVDKDILLTGSNYELLLELTNKKEELSKQLEEKVERWMYLSEINNKIEEYRRNKI